MMGSARERSILARESASRENAAEEKLVNVEYHRLLQQAINNLSPQQQQVYRMAKEQDLSYKAISKSLSISLLTVKTHMARALISIRIFLKKNEVVPLLVPATAMLQFYFF